MKTTEQFRKSCIAVLLAAIASITVTSCVDNDDEINYGSGVTALVTYEQTTSTIAPGSETASYTTTFTFYGPNNTPATTLICGTRIDESIIKPGQRCIIEYIPADYANPTATGAISLIRYRGIATTTITTAPKAEAEAANAEINLWFVNGEPSLTRTGRYINVEAYMPYVEGRTFSIVADETTVNTAMPELYLTTTATGTPQGFMQTVIGSIDIQPVWGRPEVEGIRLHINNTNSSNRQDVFEFKKY